MSDRTYSPLLKSALTKTVKMAVDFHKDVIGGESVDVALAKHPELKNLDLKLAEALFDRYGSEEILSTDLVTNVEKVEGTDLYQFDYGEVSGIKYRPLKLSDLNGTISPDSSNRRVYYSEVEAMRDMLNQHTLEGPTWSDACFFTTRIATPADEETGSPEKIRGQLMHFSNSAKKSRVDDFLNSENYEKQLFIIDNNPYLEEVYAQLTDNGNSTELDNPPIPVCSGSGEDYDTIEFDHPLIKEILKSKPVRVVDRKGLFVISTFYGDEFVVNDFVERDPKNSSEVRIFPSETVPDGWIIHITGEHLVPDGILPTFNHSPRVLSWPAVDHPGLKGKKLVGFSLGRNVRSIPTEPPTWLQTLETMFPYEDPEYFKDPESFKGLIYHFDAPNDTSEFWSWGLGEEFNYDLDAYIGKDQMFKKLDFMKED